jgi:hypothetical protein
MTHDELLKEINQFHGETAIADLLSNALRAVVELHKPFGLNSNNLHLCCIACADFDDGEVIPAAYPCPTIQAIEKELA